jgi:hypothetical protein
LLRDLSTWLSEFYSHVVSAGVSSDPSKYGETQRVVVSVRAGRLVTELTNQFMPRMDKRAYPHLERALREARSSLVRIHRVASAPSPPTLAQTKDAEARCRRAHRRLLAAITPAPQRNAETADSYESGLPGRRSIAHLLLAEMEQRAKRGQLCLSLREEAQALLDWAANAHPNAPRVTLKTIENSCRAKFRSLKTAPK